MELARFVLGVEPKRPKIDAGGWASNANTPNSPHESFSRKILLLAHSLRGGRALKLGGSREQLGCYVYLGLGMPTSTVNNFMAFCFGLIRVRALTWFWAYQLGVGIGESRGLDLNHLRASIIRSPLV